MADQKTDQQALAELDRLLASREFATAERAGRFLRYVIERTLCGDRNGLKESVIGTEVFDRSAGYDPKVEPIVRTEARRLRAKLEEFYSHNHDSVVRISVPKGSYVAAFELVGQPAILPLPSHPEPPKRWRWIWAVSAAVVVGGVALASSFIHWGGRAGVPALTTVTSFPGGQSYPSLSPNARQVVFAWRREEEASSHIYTANVDGSQPRRVTSDAAGDTFPAWSPDGSRIAFIRAGKGIVVVNPSGGEARFLAPAFPAFLAWSPDNHRIVYCDWTDKRTQFALFSVDVATGAHRQISNPPAEFEGDLQGDFSPDGRQLAFGRCRLASCDLYSMPSEGGGPLRKIAEGGARFSGVTWSPNGRSIVFSARRLGTFQLWKTDANGSGNVELLAVAGEDALFPSFGRNPSGLPRLVYEQHINDSNIWRIRLDAVGAAAEPHRLIASTRMDSSPQVSPDGRKIAFVSDRSGFEEVWTVDADGENATEVTHLRARGLGSPRWSPDSRQLAFDAMGSDGRAIFLVDTSGGDPRKWSQSGSAGRPSWSRDGQWIYFGDEDAARDKQIFRISATDRERRVQMTRDGAFEAFESADGKSLFYLHGHELRRMPAGGGEPSPVTGRQLFMGLWSVAENGIYFVDLASTRTSGNLARGEKPVDLLDPASGAVRRIGAIAGDMVMNLPDFSVSPDGKALYYSILEVSVSQIRMIEGGF